MIVILGVLLFSITFSFAEPELTIPKIGLSIDEANNPKEVANTIEILFLITILAIAPSILMMMTSFTRIIIVLSFVRKAISTQTTPPNQVLVGLALFLTFFIMAPIGTEINNTAIQPYLRQEITQEVALQNAMEPVREFMFKQTREKDLALFINISKSAKPQDLEDIPTKALIPAFIISELKTGFQIGFILFIPFIIIDMVVSSTLMSMGMMMLPPVMISLPFKILLFILVDGWNLIIKSLVMGFK
ncbi:MAG: flagellar type III secretion system pore protein FliP [Bacillota bacterium]